MSQKSPIMEYFAYEHLPQHLQPTSKAFSELANAIENNHLAGPEKSVVLRKLLEAKDAAVRSRLYTNKHADPNVATNGPGTDHLI